MGSSNGQLLTYLTANIYNKWPGFVFERLKIFFWLPISVYPLTGVQNILLRKNTCYLVNWSLKNTFQRPRNWCRKTTQWLMFTYDWYEHLSLVNNTGKSSIKANNTKNYSLILLSISRSKHDFLDTPINFFPPQDWCKIQDVFFH